MAKVDLFPDFRAFLKSLNSAGVRYLIVGGYAVIHYGYRRMTDDLDVWIAMDPVNAEKVSKVLQTFGGFPAAKVGAAVFQVPKQVFMFGREPARIDILTRPSGVDFESSYAARNEVIWDGVKVPLISIENLKLNKHASGRVKDLADLENLSAENPISPVRGEKSKRRRGKE